MITIMGVYLTSCTSPTSKGWINHELDSSTDGSIQFMFSTQSTIATGLGAQSIDEISDIQITLADAGGTELAPLTLEVNDFVDQSSVTTYGTIPTTLAAGDYTITKFEARKDDGTAIYEMVANTDPRYVLLAAGTDAALGDTFTVTAETVSSIDNIKLVSTDNIFSADGSLADSGFGYQQFPFEVVDTEQVRLTVLVEGDSAFDFSTAAFSLDLQAAKSDGSATITVLEISGVEKKLSFNTSQ